MSEAGAQPDATRARLARGDRDALAEVFAAHHGRLRRMVSFRMDRRLAGRLDPEDVLQEAYLAAAQRLERYASNPAWSPFIWLRMVVLQTLTDLYRRHLGAQRRDADREAPFPGLFPQTTSVSLAAVLAGRFTTPSQAAARAEMFDRVERAIAGMEALDQEVLALRHFEELTNSEVAEALGIQPKAASIRYVRALRRLKGILGELSGSCEG